MAEISNTPYAEPSMTPSQANQVVSSVGINPADVLSAGNVAQTITNPAPIPTDLLGIRANIYNTLGVNTAQSAYDSALGLVNTATAGLRTGLQQLSNRPVSLSKITGQQGQLREVAGNEIQALSEAANLKLNTLNALKTEAETQFGIREAEISQIRSLQAQYPGANIKFGDSFDKAIERIEKYTEEQEKKALKDALKETARSLGINTSGMSRKALEKAIAKENKSALDMTKQKFDLDMEATRAQIAKLRSGGGSGLTPAQQAAADADEKEAFYNDVANLREGMSVGDADKETAQSLGIDTSGMSRRELRKAIAKVNWDYSWNYINNKYPGLNADAIDNALGLSYRDGQLEVPEEPGVLGKIKNWWDNL